jgi:multidrug efflux pump subunit AcrA (membrane-fusion protein)
MKRRMNPIFGSPRLLLAVAAVLLAAAGCGKQAGGGHAAHGHAEKEDEGHAHADEHGHEGEAEAAGASFKEGQGISLGEDAAKEIGLQTVAAKEQKLSVRFTANARVYETAHAHIPRDGPRPNHDSHATAMLPAHLAQHLRPGQRVEVAGPSGTAIEGRLARIDAETTPAIGQAEAIVDIPDPEHALDFSSFVKVTFEGGEREVIAIPKAALLDAPGGTFAYVQNGERYMRTAVKAGAAGETAVEIIDGLHEGDVVVSRGVVDLWLIELRFTKGGGHSH